MTGKRMSYQTIDGTIGNTPLVQLVNLPGEENRRRNNVILAKLEGYNPSGSIKARSVFAMVRYAEERGEIRPGDTLIEATSGNSGIALAMIAARRGYRCTLVMPENTIVEQQQCMKAYGAEIILTPKLSGMGFARSLAAKMVGERHGVTLDQFANPDNPRAHYETTAPEIWEATGGKVTHVICSMGTTGTIMGISQYLKEKNSKVNIIGVEPETAGRTSGMWKWTATSMPRFFDKRKVDRIESANQAYAEHMARRLAMTEGIFCGISSAAACDIALRLSIEMENATIVFIAPDLGDRYFSTGVFPA
ncbi:MAG: cysteine synthase CysM [Burkholderiaceae bacterium]|jgi:cysteine synthase B|nr:cysteine synthase CysM [Burkholderiaceae bacterium]